MKTISRSNEREIDFNLTDLGQKNEVVRKFYKNMWDHADIALVPEIENLGYLIDRICENLNKLAKEIYYFAPKLAPQLYGLKHDYTPIFTKSASYSAVFGKVGILFDEGISCAGMT